MERVGANVGADVEAHVPRLHQPGIGPEGSRLVGAEQVDAQVYPLVEIEVPFNSLAPAARAHAQAGDPAHRTQAAIHHPGYEYLLFDGQHPQPPMDGLPGVSGKTRWLRRSAWSAV